MNLNDLDDVYEKVKTYLDISDKLKVLKDTLIEDEIKLQSSVKDMKELTQEIKEQAQAALIQ